MEEPLRQKASALEDAFFAKQDAILIEKLRELERMEQTQKALSEVSGISNEKILTHLVELDIHAV